jgi:hypothetical protein
MVFLSADMTQQDVYIFMISAKGKIINVSHLFRHATRRTM